MVKKFVVSITRSKMLIKYFSSYFLMHIVEGKPSFSKVNQINISIPLKAVCSVFVKFLGINWIIMFHSLGWKKISSLYINTIILVNCLVKKLIGNFLLRMWKFFFNWYLNNLLILGLFGWNFVLRNLRYLLTKKWVFNNSGIFFNF